MTTHTAAPPARRRPDGRPARAAHPVEPERVEENPAVRVVHGTARTLEAMQSELPRSSWPVLVGAGALVATGVLDLGVAIGVTVLYLTVRHWPWQEHRPAPEHR